MRRNFVLLILCVLSSLRGLSQQLPLGTCGIVCTYDASGNRLRRVYFCNNGIDQYPVRTKEELTERQEVQLIDALYPNPTTGKFFVTFSKQLKNARVYLTDPNGKVIRQFTASGYRLDFDLSLVAAGVYMVRIEDEGLIVTKKVVKQ